MTLIQATLRGLEKGHKITRLCWSDGNWIFAKYGIQLKARTAGNSWYKAKTANWAPTTYEILAKDWIVLKDE